MSRIDRTVCVDLVLDTGELVRIECPVVFEEEMYDLLEHTMKRKDWFPVTRWDGCTAEYMGLSLDRVNMARVVGML